MRFESVDDSSRPCRSRAALGVLAPVPVRAEVAPASRGNPVTYWNGVAAEALPSIQGAGPVGRSRAFAFVADSGTVPEAATAGWRRAYNTLISAAGENGDSRVFARRHLPVVPGSYRN